MKMNGEINILDGQFTFDKFPYPVRKATGKLVFGNNPVNGWEQLEIVGLRGHGLRGRSERAGGPAHSRAHQPVRAGDRRDGEHRRQQRLQRAAALLRIPAGDAIGAQAVRRAGQVPKFRGGFECDVHHPSRAPPALGDRDAHPPGRSHGKLAVFPYPMEGVSGNLTIRDDSVKIENAVMKRGDASLHWTAGFRGIPRRARRTRRSTSCTAHDAADRPDAPAAPRRHPARRGTAAAAGTDHFGQERSRR